MLLRRVEIEVALAVDDVDRTQATGGALARQARLHARFARLGARRAGRPLERGVLGNFGAMGREVQRGIVAILDHDVREVRRFCDHQLGNAIGIAGLALEVLLNQRCFGTLAERDDDAPLLSSALRGNLVGRVERQLNLDSSRHVQQQTVGPKCTVLGRKLLVVANNRAQHGLHEVTVLLGQSLEAAKDHALRSNCGTELIEHHTTVAHHDAAGVLALCQDRALRLAGYSVDRRGIRREIDATQRREAPVLVRRGRHRQHLIALGRLLATLFEPRGHPTEPSICS